MAKKLYIGNLSRDTTEQQLRDLFSPTGEITDLVVINDRATGTSKGFGFVTMATDAASDQLIDQFNGYTLDSRDIVVNEARPREERAPGQR
jgi:cold-inducible RNA-binding protein